ncbi:small acidic protein 1 [Lycium barbarum]|uniref:small acidic protein 1 n=1 Tax=Lycium barbarum TaxID=112863 RepID=UPI00293F5BD9|nr:small acidic protein 1 [Lycium barbarum]
MKPMVVDYLADMEEQGSTMAMDVDEVDAIDIFGENPLGGEHLLRLADADFFNSFHDDFDDSDIN